MDLASAKLRLGVHSGTQPGEGSFLGMLRPYRGLDAAVFRDLAQAVAVVVPHLQTSSAQVDKKLMNALWGVVFFATYWGVNPEGILQRNGLITPLEVERLRRWTDAIGWAVAMSLDGEDEVAALSLLRGIPEAGLS